MPERATSVRARTLALLLAAAFAPACARRGPPAAAATPGAAPLASLPAPSPPESPLAGLGAAAILDDDAARTAYLAMLGDLRDEPWLALLDGPSPESRWVAVDGRRYLLASDCKNHDCYDNSVVLLYDPGAGVMYGGVQRSGQWTLLGGPPAPLAWELGRLWREEFRQLQP